MSVCSRRPSQRFFPLAGLLLLAGAAQAGVVTIDPGTAPYGTDLTNYYSADGVTLSAINGTASTKIVAATDFGNPVFGWQDTAVSGSTPNNYFWSGHTPDLQANLSFGAQSVSIDALGNFDLATLSAFDSSMNLIGTTTQAGNPFGGQWTLTYNSASPDIYGIRVSLASQQAPDETSLTHLVLTTAGTQPVPEPGSLALLAIGGLPLVGLLRRKHA